MKYGVHRTTWGRFFNPSDLKTFFKQAKNTGADAVEFSPPDEAMSGDWAYAEKVKQMASDEGLEILFCFGYPTGADMCSANLFSRQFAAQHLTNAVRAAVKLGGTEIGGVLYSTWPADYAHDMITPTERYDRQMRSIEMLRTVTPVAEECDIMLNFEVLNRFDNYIINTVEEGIWFLRQLESPCCGLLLDVFHMNIEEDDIPAAIRAAKGHIGKFHATEPNRGIPYHNTRVQWPKIGKALRDADFNGAVIMETVLSVDNEVTYNMRGWRNLLKDLSIDCRIEAMRRGITFLREQFDIGIGST